MPFPTALAHPNGMTPSTEFIGRRVAFVATRIAGEDGVSLEIEKWAAVLERMGIECFYIAGESDRPPERRALIELADFQHPRILEISRRAFGTGARPSALTDSILSAAQEIRIELNKAIAGFGVEAIIAENALTIPMNIPLGLAILLTLHETRVGCIAHHHDFYWERERFLVNQVGDFIHFAFPPALPQIQQVVINSEAAEEFSRRTGLSCSVIPNVMDFANPPVTDDDYACHFRHDLGISDSDLLVLQPTRVVARKGIEHSVELVRRLGSERTQLVISHAAGDEGADYANFLNLFSDLMRVHLIFADRWVGEQHGIGPDGRRIYRLDDVYRQADLVAYPSEYEGFGNAFLEAVYYRRPVLCKRYPIFRRDIEPCGFDTLTFDDYITAPTVTAVQRLVSDTGARQEMVEHNYRIASQYFSYEVLEEGLRPLLRRALMLPS